MTTDVEMSPDLAEGPSPAPTAPPVGRRRMIVRGGLWTATAQLLPSVGVAVLSVVAARLLGADALGRQSLIAYVNSALTAVVVTGLSAAMLTAQGSLLGAGDGASLDRLSAWSVRAHAVAGGAVFLVLVAIGAAVGRDELAWTVIGLVTVVDGGINGLAVAVAVRRGWAEVGRLQLVAQLAGPPLGVVAVVVGLGITGIFAADGVAAVVLLVVVVRRYHAFARSPGGWRPPVPVARSWVMFSASELITQVVARRAEFVVLAIVSSDRQIATYSIAFMIVSLAAQAPASIAVAALPVVAAADARGEHDTSLHHLRLSVRVGTALSLPLTGLVVALAPPAITLVYGRAYGDAARLAPLGAVVLLSAVAAGICGQYWSGRGWLRGVLLIGTAAAVLDLGTAFALVPALGATGAVIANIAAQALSAAALLVLTARRTGRIGWSVRSLVGMAAATVAGTGAAVAAVRETAWAMHGVTGTVTALAQLVAGAVAGIAAFAAASWTVKVLAADEHEWLAPLLPARLVHLLATVTLPAEAPA